MSCSKCCRVSNQMICSQCYITIKSLHKDKLEQISEKQQQLQLDLKASAETSKLFHYSLEQKYEKIKLNKKIQFLQKSNLQAKKRIKEKKQKLKMYQQQRQQLQQMTKNAINTRIQLMTKYSLLQHQVQIIIHQKEEHINILIDTISLKFKNLLKIMSQDPIEPCDFQSWNYFVNNKGLDYFSYEGQTPKNLLKLPSQEIAKSVYILDDGLKHLKLIAAHFQRSIWLINSLALIYQVTLPYPQKVGDIRSFSIKNQVFKQNKFSYALLKRHEANTIYLYSRACITVYYPNIEQGRLQELHDAFMNRLKGYNLNPFSLQAIKQLDTQELTACGIVRHYEQKKMERQLQEEDNFLTSSNQFFGIEQIDIQGDIDNEIELLI